jgi:hypothetical protein
MMASGVIPASSAHDSTQIVAFIRKQSAGPSWERRCAHGWSLPCGSSLFSRSIGAQAPATPDDLCEDARRRLVATKWSCPPNHNRRDERPTMTRRLCALGRLEHLLGLHASSATQYSGLLVLRTFRWHCRCFARGIVHNRLELWPCEQHQALRTGRREKRAPANGAWRDQVPADSPRAASGTMDRIRAVR